MKIEIGEPAIIKGNSTDHGFEIGHMIIVDSLIIKGLYECSNQAGKCWAVAECDLGSAKEDDL